MPAADEAETSVSDQWPDRGDMALSLLMGEWVVLMETIRQRLDQLERIDPDSVDEDVLADLYEDQQTLTHLLAYVEDNFARTFGGLPAPATWAQCVAKAVGK
ncbi:hypothetical protein WK60_28990 [Burkholderia ubonensis]|uniref:hypothetical protein n=1 Tax=Burkholderia ubonensis TaxID=101571 RepID=UPI00076DD3D2|nr:hypothetical protein [Burkholderia ubonensis]KVU03589.1 hypothetical protein WK60_28990 [Burkholderia ubonensis]